jgi:alkanesulfonate monooxygenase SsuD/methylene tetrahydromethanopterin reductase-like flavin-dependent oxidoreductase (luciferase family)
LVRYGIALPTGGECGDPRFLLELAVSAEQNGWEGVFLEDYVFYQGDPTRPTCNTWVALAAIAVRTVSIVLGVEVVALTRRRPCSAPLLFAFTAYRRRRTVRPFPTRERGRLSERCF